MDGRQSEHVANAARFQLRYGELIAALHLGILNCGVLLLSAKLWSHVPHMT
jgi:hypothetical protein